MVQRFGGVVFILALGILQTYVALGQDVETWMVRGQFALDEGRYGEALDAFEQVIRQDHGHAEAHYMLARLYLETPLLDSGKAKQAIKQAIMLAPKSVRYLELELWRRYTHGSTFLPAVQTAKQREQAEKILALEPNSALAHFVLGAIAFEDFSARYGAVAFPVLEQISSGFDEEEAAQARTVHLLDADLVVSDTGAVIEFVDRQRSGQRVQPVSEQKETRKAYTRAIGHLQRAITSDPTRREAYTLLMHAYALHGAYVAARDMLDQMFVQFPNDSATWLYLGLVYYKLNQFVKAEASFERACTLMSPYERSAFINIDYLLNRVAQVFYENGKTDYTAGFWEGRDPRLLTPVNERKLEHYARLAYADLRFGAMREGQRGWETEPGQVVMRYGEPRVEARYSTMMDTYLLFHYGDFRFLFMDPVKSGEMTFYSPPASAFTGPRNVHREWANDYAILGPQTFRKSPDRSTFEATNRVAFPFLTSAFKGRDGQADLYVSLGIPLSPEANIRRLETGAFLVSREKGLLQADRRQHKAADPAHLVVSGDNTFWVHTHRLRVSSGAHETSIEFEAETTAPVVGFERTTVKVPDFFSRKLQMSDVLLAYSIEENAIEGNTTVIEEVGYITRDGLSIQSAPWGVFATTQPIHLYFEVYNLGLDVTGASRYEVEAVLVPVKKEKDLEKLIRRAFGGGQEAGVSVRFTGTGTTSDEGQYLILDAQGAEAGRYLLAVRVTDQGRGEAVEARRNLVLK